MFVFGDLLIPGDHFGQAMHKSQIERVSQPNAVSLAADPRFVRPAFVTQRVMVKRGIEIRRSPAPLGHGQISQLV